MLAASGLLGAGPADTPFRRNRPGDPGWPGPEAWAALDRRVGGRLLRPRSPFDGGGADPRLARNPFALGDDPALTQTSGWAGAWASAPSAWAVAARDAADVAAAVDFARAHRLRLVVKGGGHSYLGGSNAPDSLLVWTRAMDAIALHDGFTGQGCDGTEAPRPAVSLGAGVLWGRAYAAVSVEAGRYVQGGGCTTVGVAGLVLGGGFGSFSKRYGLAAASLLEAELVTADGAVRIANPCRDPELFWALKGGGGSFGVVTRLTLATHELPAVFGGVNGTIRAGSDAAFRRLVDRFLAFYAEALFDPHWGEQARFRPGNLLEIAMVFQGIDAAEATRRWRPFLDWVAASPGDFTLVEPLRVLAAPARRLWDAAWLQAKAPGLLVADDRPGAPPGNVVWAGDAGQAGHFLHAYQSAWLPAGLLSATGRDRLADALVAATRHWGVSLHVNKGLAGAPAEALAAARDTAVHPAVQDAFALAIAAAAGPPAFAGMPGPDLAAAARDAGRVAAAMAGLRRLAPGGASYVSETDYFQPGWQAAFWGPNYPRLLAAKRRYDPEGLFFVHHGVGSEGWGADGFAPG